MRKARERRETIWEDRLTIDGCTLRAREKRPATSLLDSPNHLFVLRVSYSIIRAFPMEMRAFPSNTTLPTAEDRIDSHRP